MGSRITISEKETVSDEIISLREAIKERQKTQTTEEIMADLMQHLFSDSEEPFK